MGHPDVSTTSAWLVALTDTAEISSSQTSSHLQVLAVGARLPLALVASRPGCEAQVESQAAPAMHAARQAA